jgi:hypothetical protein
MVSDNLIYKTMSQPAIQIHFNRTIGRIKPVHGANLGPLCYQGAVDLSPYFKKIEFPTIRLHDCMYYYSGAVDIPFIFPLFHLDENDPRNYQFKRTDNYIKSILDCGSKIVYRLGVSIQCHKKFIYDTDPPGDYLKWARIAVNIIKHYNQGWANGFQHNIQYWEIWNEAENGRDMWNGTWEQFVDFFITTAIYIKSQCPEIKIGGPAFNGEMIKSQDIMHRFLPFLKQRGCPLDFLSWHGYTERPSQQTNAAVNVRAILDQYGFTRTESHLNEWNMAPPEGRDHPDVIKNYNERKKGPQNSALAAACLIAMQDAPIDMANFYDAANGFWGMFHDYGYPAKPFFAFKAFKTLIDTAPNRLEVEGSDPDNALAVLAGASPDNLTRQILISNFQNAAPILWKITLNNLGSMSTHVSFYVLDGLRDLQREHRQVITTPTATINYRILPHTVYLITLKE